MEPMTKYREYAHLLITVGLNVQRGQDLVIACPVECAWFARLCAQAAYDAGCREVLLEGRCPDPTALSAGGGRGL